MVNLHCTLSPFQLIKVLFKVDDALADLETIQVLYIGLSLLPLHTPYIALDTTYSQNIHYISITYPLGIIYSPTTYPYISPTHPLHTHYIPPTYHLLTPYKSICQPKVLKP